MKSMPAASVPVYQGKSPFAQEDVTCFICQRQEIQVYSNVLQAAAVTSTGANHVTLDNKMAHR